MDKKNFKTKLSTGYVTLLDKSLNVIFTILLGYLLFAFSDSGKKVRKLVTFTDNRKH